MEKIAIFPNLDKDPKLESGSVAKRAFEAAQKESREVPSPETHAQHAERVILSSFSSIHM